MNRIGAALELIADLPSVPDVEGMAERLREVVGRFGFETMLATGADEADGAIDAHALLVGWNRALLERRIGEAATARPVPAKGEITPMPARPGAGRAGAGSSALPDRWVLIPIGRTGGDLTAAELAVLRLLGTVVEERLRQIAGKPKTRGERPLLSRRERECLQWTAAGKTTWEISAILEISQNTIDGYIASATKKLGAVNRTQAVAEALRRAMID